MKKFVYRNRKTKEISFPLGGIGTGSIGLAGNGQLKDFEIFNKPNKGSFMGFSHFAVKAETRGKVLDARVLVGDLQPPYTGSGLTDFTGFGFGVSRSSMQGLPHFKDYEFIGEFPFASLDFRDKKFPGKVRLSAFNPFIPLDDRNSSIPGAFFTVSIRNDSKEKLRYTASFSLKNPFAEKTVHSFRKYGKANIIILSSLRWKESDIEYGDISIATDADDCSYQEYWYRGGWFDNLQIYWQDFIAPGRLKNRAYPKSEHSSSFKYDDHALIAAHCEIESGQEKDLKFAVTWNFPNVTNYWNKEKCCDACENEKPKTWKNYYATVFKNSVKSAQYFFKNEEYLKEETLKFKNALFSSTLPQYVIDSVSANISILKSPTVLRLEDGSLYGFEGCHCAAGCCEGSCTHVWNYAYAVPFLFPSLERSMRTLDYRYNMRKDGKMGFRLQLPVGRKFWDWHACADGQFGSVVKIYCDWKISGNDAWLHSLWPKIKKSIEFAWQKTNEDMWDIDKDGVLEGRQHQTLDAELFGPNSYLTGFYLAALKAASEMALHFGETQTAKEYAALFRKGKAFIEKKCFNGRYFHQSINLKDKTILEPYKKYDRKFGSCEAFYWNTEHRELKYQIGSGCHCDQVIAQWHANICGLGEIFDPVKVKKSLHSIFRNNFKKPLRDFTNACRIYGLNDEAGLVICTWPKGGKPAVPIMYADETMHGFEYQAAVHMIQTGMVAEGLEVVKAVRDRYDGERRNPWNEFECGSNYARSMASYALLPALSGFQFDMTKNHIGFAPRISGKRFQCFWSLNSGWGTYEKTGNTITLTILHGTLTLKSFQDSLLQKSGIVKTNKGKWEKEVKKIVFKEPLVLGAGHTLEISTNTI